VTIAGRYCESSDILITDALLPPLCAGDVLAVAACGAYAPAMASNYNMALRPAIVAVANGQATLWRRRETFTDLLRCDVAAV
jgi:diaminopimelate decarboxylase